MRFTQCQMIWIIFVTLIIIIAVVTIAVIVIIAFFMGAVEQLVCCCLTMILFRNLATIIDACVFVVIWKDQLLHFCCCREIQVTRLLL